MGGGGGGGGGGAAATMAATAARLLVAVEKMSTTRTSNQDTQRKKERETRWLSIEGQKPGKEQPDIQVSSSRNRCKVRDGSQKMVMESMEMGIPPQDPDLRDETEALTVVSWYLVVLSASQ